MSDKIRELSADHLKELEEGSGIDPEVIRERGYYTEITRANLERLGYTRGQGGVGPWLVIPQYSPSHSAANGLQVKPTTPRTSKGKAIKYESPTKSAGVMDVHPRNQPLLADPKKPLWITEGVKKADAATSKGLVALSVPGVWGWMAGRIPAEAWNHVVLTGRKVYLAFDSDVFEKVTVWVALKRLSEFLEKRGASVNIVLLPKLKDQAKTGLDDYLLKHTVKDLKALVADSFPEKPPEEPGGGLWYRMPDGDDIMLANFSAKITREATKDDGVEQTKMFEIEGQVSDTVAVVEVEADEFLDMKWWMGMGSEFILLAGAGFKDKAREAIQVLSEPLKETHYTHTGWRDFGKKGWHYLMPNRAIGPKGSREDLTIDLSHLTVSDRFENLGLPEPLPLDSKAGIEAVQHSINLAVGEAAVTDLATWSAIWRPLIDQTRFGYWIFGPTGVGKSVLASLLQSHYGAGFTEDSLIGSWEDTENYLEYLGFHLKDTLLVVDDWRPAKGGYDQHAMVRKADRVFRGAANQSGRGRMTRGLNIKAPRPIRAMVLATAEDLPYGESLLARILLREMKNLNRTERFKRFTHHQHHAAEGTFAQATAQFLLWLAPRLNEIREIHAELVKEHRSLVRGTHARTTQMVADIRATVQIFMAFAEEIGAITKKNHELTMDALDAQLAADAERISEVAVEDSPIARLREYLGDLLLQDAVRIDGWPGADFQDRPWIGWYDAEEDTLFLSPNNVRAVVRQRARDLEERFEYTSARLGIDVQESRFFASGLTDNQKGAGCRRRYGGKRVRVWPINPEFLRGVADEEVDVKKVSSGPTM